jgi:hypothetical protein
MPSSSTDPGELLAHLLHRLVELLRRRDGFTWRLLVRATAGRTGYIDLDGHRLALRVDPGPPYALTVEPAPDGSAPLHFRARGAVILDILDGRTTLDRALDDGRIFVRAPLPDLLNVYLLVMNILADTPADAGLRGLYQEWERLWPYLPARIEPAPLERQRPGFGRLVREIPWSLRTMASFVTNGPRG